MNIIIYIVFLFARLIATYFFPQVLPQRMNMLKLLVTILTVDWFKIRVLYFIMPLSITPVIEFTATFRTEVVVLNL